VFGRRGVRLLRVSGAVAGPTCSLCPALPTSSPSIQRDGFNLACPRDCGLVEQIAQVDSPYLSGGPPGSALSVPRSHFGAGQGSGSPTARPSLSRRSGCRRRTARPGPAADNRGRPGPPCASAALAVRTRSSSPAWSAVAAPVFRERRECRTGPSRYPAPSSRLARGRCPRPPPSAVHAAARENRACPRLSLCAGHLATPPPTPVTSWVARARRRPELPPQPP